MQPKERSKALPPDAPWTTDAEFDAITVYFQPPADEEGFNVVRTSAADDAPPMTSNRCRGWDGGCVVGDLLR